MNLGTCNSTAFVQIPVALRGNVAKDYQRNIDVFHRPEKTKLLVFGLDRADIKHEVADTGMQTEQIWIGFGQARFNSVWDYAKSFGRKLEPPGNSLGLDVRVRQEHVDRSVKLALPDRSP